jgi:hypothetical protein
VRLLGDGFIPARPFSKLEGVPTGRFHWTADSRFVSIGRTHASGNGVDIVDTATMASLGTVKSERNDGRVQFAPQGLFFL